MLSIIEMNAAIVAEYLRVCGPVACGPRAGFGLSRWWANQLRAIIAAQAPGLKPELAAARWARLSPSERQARLLRYLRALPSDGGGGVA